jgi:hypothetical protein
MMLITLIIEVFLRDEIFGSRSIGIQRPKLGKSYSFAGFGVVPEVFSGRIRHENAVRMHSAQLGALFRVLMLLG